MSQYQAFIEDGGYSDPLLWLANGWAFVKQHEIKAPLYWLSEPGDTSGPPVLFTLAGDRSAHPNEPVCHLSYYEADAFATWLSHQGEAWQGARLPSEFEWEAAVKRLDPDFDQVRANLLRPAKSTGEPTDFLAGSPLHPLPARACRNGSAILQSCGDLWEWTSSHYEPYPGYRPFEGDLMEYNGKFMDNQRVLRGGSCASPVDHLRPTYRNFWPASTRFQFSGFRLSRSRT